jgi:hypothetical protein
MRGEKDATPDNLTTYDSLIRYGELKFKLLTLSVSPAIMEFHFPEVCHAKRRLWLNGAISHVRLHDSITPQEGIISVILVKDGGMGMDIRW